MKIYNKMNFGYATESDSQPENKYSEHNTMLNLVEALVYDNSTTNSIEKQINTDILKNHLDHAKFSSSTNGQKCVKS